MLGQNARNVFGETAAGDVRQRLQCAGLADRLQKRLHIDAGRRQQRFAKLLAIREGAGASQPRPETDTILRTSEKPFE